MTQQQLTASVQGNGTSARDHIYPNTKLRLEFYIARWDKKRREEPKE
jgi:hypothetical protein